MNDGAGTKTAAIVIGSVSTATEASPPGSTQVFMVVTLDLPVPVLLGRLFHQQNLYLQNSAWRVPWLPTSVAMPPTSSEPAPPVLFTH